MAPPRGRCVIYGERQSMAADVGSGAWAGFELLWGFILSGGPLTFGIGDPAAGHYPFPTVL